MTLAPLETWKLDYCQKVGGFTKTTASGTYRKYSAKFTCNSPADGCVKVEQWVVFYTNKPTAACRHILSSGLRPLAFSKQVIDLSQTAA